MQELLESVTDFLVGPGRSEDDLDIDDIFAKSLDHIISEMQAFDPRALVPTSDFTPSTTNPSYCFQSVEGGVMLYDENGQLAGAYLSCDVAIGEAHQGQGLGAELILERYLRFGDLPTWHLDKAAYTSAGYAAHAAAWQMSQNDSLVERKIASIEDGGRSTTQHMRSAQ